MKIIRKRLSEDEMTAITDIRQTGGQLEIVRGNTGVWENVVNADNVRRDGSTVIVGKQKFRSGNADGLISLNPDVNERALDVRLPVTTLQDVIRVVDSNGITKFRVDSLGRFQLRGTDSDQFLAFDQSGNQRWRLDTRLNQTPFVLYASNGQTADILAIQSFAGNRIFSVSGSGASYSYGASGLRLMSSASMRDAYQSIVSWLDGTDATRRAQVVFNIHDWTGGREFMRASSTGSAAAIGFLGATPVTRPTVSGAVDFNSALASLLSALSHLGLITDNTTIGVPPWRPAELAVTGERDGNTALASLMDALSTQGIIWNQTTEGTKPAGGSTICAAAFGVADGWNGQMSSWLTLARAYIVANPSAYLNLFCDDLIAATEWLVEASSALLWNWFADHNMDGNQAYQDRLDTIDLFLSTLANADTVRELRFVAYCQFTSPAPSADDIAAYCAALDERHFFSPIYRAFVELYTLGIFPVERVQFFAMQGNDNPSAADCAGFECNESTGWIAFAWDEINDPKTWTSTFNTVLGASYKIAFRGTCWSGTGGTRQDADAAYYSNNGWSTTHWSASLNVLRVNSAAFNPTGAIAYASDHKYEKLIAGTGSPITIQWANYPSYAGTTGGDFEFSISGQGVTP